MPVIQVKSTPGMFVAMAPILIGSPDAGSPVPIPHAPDSWMLLAPPPAGAVPPAVVAPPVSVGAAVVAAPVSGGAAVVAAAVSVGAAVVAAAGSVPPPVVSGAAPSSSSSPHAASIRTAAAAIPSSERFIAPPLGGEVPTAPPSGRVGGKVHRRRRSGQDIKVPEM